jgi:hypothetical protein
MAFKPQPPKKNLSYDPKLSLTGEPWVEGDYSKKPTLHLVAVNSAGNKNSTVKTATLGVWFKSYLNHPDESDTAKAIDVKLDLGKSFAFLEMLEACIADTNFTMAGVEASGFTFPGGQRSDKPSVLGTVFVGRNGDGEICLILQAPNRPTAVFPFNTDQWFNIVDKQGRPVDKPTVSKYIAGGWCKLLRGVLVTVAKDIYEEKAAALEKNTEAGSGYEKPSGGYEQKPYTPGATYAPKPKPTDVFDSIH